MKKGLFIVFEGADGAGKSTQIALLKSLFKKIKIPVVTTREPGGTQKAEYIRTLIKKQKFDALTELFLFQAGRSNHCREMIRPSLEARKVVLCDRFTGSSIVYQGIARGLKVSLVEQLNEVATGGLKADITILLDSAFHVSKNRRKSRKTSDHLEADVIQKRVIRGYRDLAKRKRWWVYSADEAPLALHSLICQDILKYLKLRHARIVKKAKV